MSKERTKPPMFYRWLFEGFLSPFDRRTAPVDLEEEFFLVTEEEGLKKALKWYRRQVLRSVPLFLLNLLYWSIAMFKNYLKIALRNIKKQKGFSFINLSGLSIGIACCILILLYVQYELSYDKYHENADRIYRVSREFFNSDGVSTLYLGTTAAPTGRLLKNEFPEIEEVARFRSLFGRARYEEKTFTENGIFMVDPEVFRIFSWEFIHGDPESALFEPNSIVITRTAARKYFSDESPEGRIITFEILDKMFDMKVTGIIEDIPDNSHFQFDILASWSTFVQMFDDFYNQKDRLLTNWGNNSFATYIQLPYNYDIKKLKEKMPVWISEKTQRPLGSSLLHFWKLTDIHLHSHLDLELGQNGDIKYVYIFSTIAVFILLIACFNFMNLSTARSAVRAKEIGVRKAVGAVKKQLMRQFLTETFLFAVLALIIAVGIVLIFIPPFRNFVNIPDLSLNVFDNYQLLSGLSIMLAFVGLAAGGYPAFLLSSFRPAAVLKGDNSGLKKRSNLRTALVVMQFSISVVLIISLGVVEDQLDFIRNKELGFNKDNILTFYMDPGMRGNYNSIKNELLSDPDITNVTISSRIPSGRLLDNSTGSIIDGNNATPIDFRLPVVWIEPDFFSTFEMNIKEGRDFSIERAADRRGSFIINEKAVESLGLLPEEAIGKSIMYAGITGKIIGVVGDFHFESLHQPIKPMIFGYNAGNFNMVSIRFRSGNAASAVENIDRIIKKYNTGAASDYFLIDDRYDNLYTAEAKLGSIFRLFSLLAIVIACLGLFGLASYITERRTKEMGIRKTLGSSLSAIIILLSKEFIKWVIIANLIACPIAWYAMNRWLEGFAYKMSPGIDVFILSGVSAMIIALFAVSYQSIKTALANPVNSLRYE
ncbi:ABC transporter permease [candidate division KSB1 bacterium]